MLPLEGNRVLLRKITLDDAPAMFQLDSDAEVHRYLGNKPLQNMEDVKKIISFINLQYLQNGVGRLALIDKKTNMFMGWVGLKLVTETINGFTNYYDLGYRLIKKYWHKGYATEGAQLALSLGFNELNLNIIYAAAHINNAASNHILSKLQFTKKNKFMYDGSHHFWYELPKQNWQNRI